MNMGFKMKDCKTGPVRGWVLEGGEKWIEEVKEGDCDQRTLYTNMK
jgi:hypothetical protein